MKHSEARRVLCAVCLECPNKQSKKARTMDLTKATDDFLGKLRKILPKYDPQHPGVPTLLCFACYKIVLGRPISAEKLETIQKVKNALEIRQSPRNLSDFECKNYCLVCEFAEVNLKRRFTSDNNPQSPKRSRAGRPQKREVQPAPWCILSHNRHVDLGLFDPFGCIFNTPIFNVFISDFFNLLYVGSIQHEDITS